MNRSAILQLLAANRKRGFFRAEAKGDEATLYLYDVIVSDELTAEWMGGIAPEAFAIALAAIDAPTVHLRINSPGGDVFAARAIEQAIREHGAHVVAHVDGYAASAASIVAIAADEVEIAKGGFFMIHDSWTFAMGNKGDLQAVAALLEKVDGTLAQTYADETGQKLEDVVAWMAAETWFTGEEAVLFGFADRVAAGAEKDKAKAKAQARAAQWDLSAYLHPPKTAAAPAPKTADHDPAHARRANHDHEQRRRELALATRGISVPR